MKMILTILLTCFIWANLFAQKPQFDCMMYGCSYPYVKEKYGDVGFKPISMSMHLGQFTVIFMSPTPQFSAICYKFKENECISIDLYLKTDNIWKVRRVLNSDSVLKKESKDVWLSAKERISLKNAIGPGGKSLYLECVKLK